jgi:hypothetical protein
MNPVSIHEAAHCVVGRAVGLSVERVVLYPDGSGETAFSGGDPNFYVDAHDPGAIQEMRNTLAALLAGEIAERRFFGRDEAFDWKRRDRRCDAMIARRIVVWF